MKLMTCYSNSGHLSPKMESTIENKCRLEEIHRLICEKYSIEIKTFRKKNPDFEIEIVVK